MSLLVAITPFVLLEFALRITTQTTTQENIDTDPVVDLHQLKPLFELNSESNEYRIPESRFNFFQPASFPATKGVATKRIFVLGGSTVQGRPYAPETSFSAWLQLRLQAADADTRFEVINCGGVSYASYRIDHMLDEVLQYQPDAIVLYTGHNEFLEDRSYGKVRQFGPVRSLASRLGARLHTVRWLQTMLLDTERHLLPMEVDARLDHSGGLESYHRDKDWQSAVEQHFHWTLQQICAKAKRSGVPMILCVPASDLIDTPPIKTETLPFLGRDRSAAFDQNWLVAKDSNAEWKQRLDAASKCLKIDSQHAGAHFVAGRLLFDHGDAAAAKAHLVAARDHDVCPLRATTPIVESVRAIAAQHALPLVDTPVLSDQRRHDGRRIPDGIPDGWFFVDHVHPRISGHQTIAKALAETFEKIGWVTNDDESEKRYEGLVEQHLGSLDESYFAAGQARLEGLRRWTTGRIGQLGID